MQWVETTGRSIDDAKAAALAELGVAEADAEVVVVAEPKPGLFGRVRSEARIRARVRPTEPPAKDGKRRSRSRGDTRRRGRGRSSTDSTKQPDSRSRGSREDKEPVVDSDQDLEEVPLEEQGEVASAFVEGVVSRFGLEARVSSALLDEDTVRVAVDGDELGLLIGPKGQTLDALQDLARTAVFRETGARHGYVVVDVSDYRAKRRAALQKFVQGLAQEALDTGEDRALEPMNPADRKVVHDTVNEIDGVTTSSEGEEPRRYVVIRPA